MPDILFPTWITNKLTPVLADRILIADSEDSWNPKDSELSSFPFPEIQANTFQYKTSITVWSSNADYITDGTADNVQIQEAIDAVNTAWGWTVFINEWTYTISGRMTPKSNVTIIGSGKWATTLIGWVVSDWMFYNTTAISNFSIRDITLDCNNTATGWLLWLNKTTNWYFYNVEFKNVASGGWHAVIGIATVATAIDCFNNIFENCTFDTHAGSLEMLLLMNADNTKLINCVFKNKTTLWPVVWLYQQLENTLIDGCVWDDNIWFSMYYSLSCNNTIVTNSYFGNTGGGLQGANLSDNWAFWETSVRWLVLSNNIFLWWSNSTSSTAIQLWATDWAIITWNIISDYNIWILLDGGNTGVPVLSTNFVVSENILYNNTAFNGAHSINPAIFFASIGGSCYGNITENKFYDTQGTQTQRYPITFYGAFTWDYLNIANNRMSAYGWWTSIGLISSAVLGSNVKIFDNQDYTGSSPAQTSYVSLIWDQTIAGIKTFSSSPIVPTPTTATQAVNKEYADYTPDFYKYSIVTSVASGNLTVALKNYEGNDPTPTKPVKIQIGWVVRTITSALATWWAASWDAGTNYLNLWSAELATKETDLFVYAWYSGGAVNLYLARFPTANKYDDFNASNTNEKGRIRSLNVTPANWDPVVNIGRFNATLSAGAGYTWTVWTTIINQPMFQTRYLDFVPVGAGYTAGWAKYRVDWNNVNVIIDSTTDITGNITVPFTCTNTVDNQMITSAWTAVLPKNSATITVATNPQNISWFYWI